MKYVFIVNPNAGKKENKEGFFNSLKEYSNKYDIEVYNTKEEKDATRYVREYLSKYSDEVTFIACGGDGTINEVLNGLVGFKNASLAIYPIGSGNDFVKVYGGRDKFLNLDHIFNGETRNVDVMKVNDMYSINVTNFGFDSHVCNIANHVRRKFLIGGKNSYTTGIIYALIKGRKNYCSIEVDGKVIHTGKMLLSTIANGKYVGGQYCCAPYSDNEDGLLEISVMKSIGILKLVSMIGKYKEGKQLEDPKIKKIITYVKGENVKISNDKEFLVCVDGEMVSNKEFNIKNYKGYVKLVVPNK